MGIPHKFGLTFDEDYFQDEMEFFLNERNITPEDATALMIKKLIATTSPLGKLLSFTMDISSDHLVSDEFYKSHPSLMLFLARAGSAHDELRFRSYQHTHPELFRCKGCGGKLIGGCPIVTCADCNKMFFMDIDAISSPMCDACVSKKLDTCTDMDRTRKFRIFGL